jgi:hypothetical protein
MDSDAAVLGVRFPLPTIARPDYPEHIAAKRRELVCCSSDPSHVGRYSFDFFVLPKTFENVVESRGFPLAFDERQRN